jgi:hypothetical protein
MPETAPNSDRAGDAFSVCRRPSIGQNGEVEERDWIGARAETPESLRYVGLSRDDALKAADTAGVKTVRVIEDSQHLSADFRSDRLNIPVADGYVKKAAFF